MESDDERENRQSHHPKGNRPRTRAYADDGRKRSCRNDPNRLCSTVLTCSVRRHTERFIGCQERRGHQQDQGKDGMHQW